MYLALNSTTMGKRANKKEIFAKVVIPRPLRGFFTYSVPDDMQNSVSPGKRVLVSFGPRKAIGLVAEIVNHADIGNIKPIIQVIDDAPVVSFPVLQLAIWAAEHYFEPPGEFLPLIVPRDKIEVDTVVAIREDLTEKPKTRSKAALDIYNVLEPKKGTRRLSLLSADLGKTQKELGKILSGATLKKFFIVRQMARRVASRGEIRPYPLTTSQKYEPVTLTHEQKMAVEAIAPYIEKKKFKVNLIHGVTGSGKTEIYASLAKKTLAIGRSVIFLTPEISLADAMSRRLERRLNIKPVVIHSDMTPKERERRLSAISSGEARIVVGARSAVFAPVKELGLIVVDEEHDGSYKQDTSPRYNGRDVAIKRGAMENIPVVLGAATPSLESYYHALAGKYNLLELKDRVDGRPMPEVMLVKPDKNWEIGEKLHSAIKTALEKKEQVLLFINRRGLARHIQCSLCGYTFECKNCSLSLVFHMNSKTLSCHTCGYEEPAPKLCPECNSTDLWMGGAGSEKVEHEIADMFPNARVARMDRDTTMKKRSSAKILESVEKREVDILIGTQMVTKGHDFPGITLVGAINADNTLHIPDFRASERTFQLITQAGGRAGRGDVAGRVIIQTLSAGHHSVESALKHDFKAFYEAEAPLRKAVGYPPYVRLALIRIDAVSESQGWRFVSRAKGMLGQIVSESPDIHILGPVEAVVFKVRNRYHWRVLIKAKTHSTLAWGVGRFLHETDELSYAERGGVVVHCDMDPASVM